MVKPTLVRDYGFLLHTAFSTRFAPSQCPTVVYPTSKEAKVLTASADLVLPFFIWMLYLSAIEKNLPLSPISRTFSPLRLEGKRFTVATELERHVFWLQ